LLQLPDILEIFLDILFQNSLLQLDRSNRIRSPLFSFSSRSKTLFTVATMTSGSKGLSRKSLQPRRISSTTISLSPYPVTTRIGTTIFFSSKRSISSIPETSGIWMSVINRSIGVRSETDWTMA